MKKRQQARLINIALAGLLLSPMIFSLIYRKPIGDWLISFYLLSFPFLYWVQRENPDNDKVSVYGRAFILALIALGFLSGWFFLEIFLAKVGAVKLKVFPYGLVVAVGMAVAMGVLEKLFIRRFFKRLELVLILNREMFPFFSLGFAVAFFVKVVD